MIEDEQKLGDYLRNGLTESGFNVDLSRDGTEGLEMALTGNFDAIVLDVMLPGVDGFKVLEIVRKSASTPVLMLTARDDAADRVKGLETGADDYLAKPFAFSELLARIRALLRRSPLQESTRFALADLQLDLTTRKANRHSQRHKEKPIIGRARGAVFRLPQDCRSSRMPEEEVMVNASWLASCWQPVMCAWPGWKICSA